MKEQIIQYFSHWLDSTSPARKAADILAMFVIALLGGGLYSAWQAESDIRRLAIKALDRSPELDADLAKKLAPHLLEDVQKAGGLAVACFKADLAGNTTQMVFYAGPDSIKERFPRLKLGLERVPFVAASMPPAQLQIASAMMTGVAEAVYFEAANVTLVAVPIPDRSGAFLAGFAMAAVEGKATTDSPVVANIRLILSEFSKAVL